MPEIAAYGATGGRRRPASVAAGPVADPNVTNLGESAMSALTHMPKYKPDSRSRKGDRLGDSHPRRAGGWGLAFVVLLLLGAGMANVPGRKDSVAQVRHFYEEHTGVVLL